MLGSEPLLWSKVVLGMLMHTRSKRNPIVALLRQGSIYWEGAPPPKKSFTEIKFTAISNKDLFDDDFKESVKVTNVQKCDFSQS